jgi:hypothetical protein
MPTPPSSPSPRPACSTQPPPQPTSRQPATGNADGPGRPEWARSRSISHGLFADAAQARSYARLAGPVLHADRRTVSVTGQHFTVARVHTNGFDTDICLAAADHPAIPEPGNIIAGTVFLVAALDL